MGLSSSDPVILASTTNIITIDEETDVYDALKIMANNKIRHLPVKNKEGNIIGMFAITDVHKALL